jgi:hypothetical protein
VVFERLAHDFKHVAREFGEFIEEEQAVMGERDFTGTWDDASADEASVRDRVMGRAKGPLGNESGRGVEDSGDGVYLGGLERFFKGERSKNGRQALGEHCLAGARRADHEDVVTSGSSNLECALGGLLAADIFEVDREMLQLVE